MRRRLSARHSRGLTLLELVVAVLVLSIGAVAALRAMDQSRVALGGAMPRLMAQIAAHNRAEELRLLGPAEARALPAQVRMGGIPVTLSVVTEATASGLLRAEIAARSPDGPGAVMVTFLPPVTGR